MKDQETQQIFIFKCELSTKMKNVQELYRKVQFPLATDGSDIAPFAAFARPPKPKTALFLHHFCLILPNRSGSNVKGGHVRSSLVIGGIS